MRSPPDFRVANYINRHIMPVMFFKRVLCALLPILVLSTLAKGQDGTVDARFYSLNFLKGALDKNPKLLSKATDSNWLYRLYTHLYNLRSQRLIFTDSLQKYVRSVETGASALERDFRLNDVGQSAAEVINALVKIDSDYRVLGARLSISNPKLEKLVQVYGNSNREIIGAQILREHRLNTKDLKTLHDISDTAAQNGERLNKAIDELRTALVTAHPDLLNGRY